jgi:hypothetical protein
MSDCSRDPPTPTEKYFITENWSQAVRIIVGLTAGKLKLPSLTLGPVANGRGGGISATVPNEIYFVDF